MREALLLGVDSVQCNTRQVEKLSTKTKRCWLDALELGRGEAVTNNNSRRRFQLSAGLITCREDNDGEKEKKTICLSIQREGRTMDLYMKEREGKLNADCQRLCPMPSTSAEPSSSPWSQARPMGSGEADWGK